MGESTGDWDYLFEWVDGHYADICDGDNGSGFQHFVLWHDTYIQHPISICRQSGPCDYSGTNLPGSEDLHSRND